jgi:hypothetical protein
MIALSPVAWCSHSSPFMNRRRASASRSRSMPLGWSSLSNALVSGSGKGSFRLYCALRGRHTGGYLRRLICKLTIIETQIDRINLMKLTNDRHLVPAF